MAFAALISSNAASEAGDAGALSIRIVTLRRAVEGDCARIAELFRMASEGVSDYVWQQVAHEYPGCPLIDIGRQRYERRDGPFSYLSCVVAEYRGETIGMRHAYAIEPRQEAVADDVDPVLRPFAELELPGSLYIMGLAVMPGYRGQGLGSKLLGTARAEARARGLKQVSLLCFAQNAGAHRLYERSGFRVIDRRAVVPHPLIHVSGDVLLMAARA